MPAAVFAAGLPDAPEKIAAVVTFTERIAYRPLQILTPDAEEIAISVPARKIGVIWAADALHEALEIACGYPYSVQLIADASWSVAGRPDPGATITLDHVLRGRLIDKGFIQAADRGELEFTIPGFEAYIHTIDD